MLIDVRRPAPMRAALTRRALLAGSVVLGASWGVAACTSDPPPEPDTSSTDGAAPDADAGIRATVAGDEAELIARYEATIAAHPELADTLTPLRDEHLAHAEAMGSNRPEAGGFAEPVPATRGQALAALIEAEQQAVALRTSACEASIDTDLARITALIAASEAGHAEFLRGVR